MLNFRKLAVLGAVLAAAVPFASATPIVLTGGLTVAGNDQIDDTFTPSTIAFSTPMGVPPSNAVVTGDSGNLATIVPAGTTGVMTGFSSTTTNQVILTLNDTQSLKFELLSIGVFSDTYTSGLGTNLDIKGFGEFLDSAGDITAMGTFDLSSEDPSCLSTTCTGPEDIGFSFVPVATPPATTPEPSSLVFLGTGLVSAAGMLVRRRRVA